jgi:3-phenylpropionate/trans-cinnamate dioxygenase ferredoxin reductase subunit
MSENYDVLVVGAGQGGVQTATNLVKDGFEGTVGLLSAEGVHPYERPPLSKGYLAGEQSFEEILLRPVDYWVRSPIDLRLGSRVTDVDAARRVVTLAGATELGYRKLVWATGGSPRTLPIPGRDLEGVFSVRDITDIDGVAKRMVGASSAVVVGGGYVGLETAAAFRKAGIAVTVLEVQDRLLARVTGQHVSDFYLSEHRRHGVDFRLGEGVAEFRGEDGSLVSAVLASGEVLAADIAIVGVGIIPNVAELAAAGAQVGNGVEVDEFCRTSLADVYAVGDCTSHVNEFAGRARVRLESVQNAIEQAKTVAAHLRGLDHPYHVAPWFWSNQYDVRLKTAGLLTGHDEVALRGDPSSGVFSVAYLREGRLIAMDCINNPKDFAQARALVGGPAVVNRARLGDAATLLKDCVAAPRAS